MHIHIEYTHKHTHRHAVKKQRCTNVIIEITRSEQVMVCRGDTLINSKRSRITNLGIQRKSLKHKLPTIKSYDKHYIYTVTLPSLNVNHQV